MNAKAIIFQAALLRLLFVTPAASQEAIPHFHNGGGIYVSHVNCDVLKGS